MHEVQLLVSVERVEVTIADVAALGEQFGQPRAKRAARREVQVLSIPRSGREMRAKDSYGEPAEYPDD